VSTVRIVLVRRPYIRPAQAPDGSEVPGWRPHQRLIVLADTVPAKDGGHRAVPLWVVAGHKELLGRLGRPAGDAEVASGLLETAVRLLGTAGTQVGAVDIEPASDDVPELRSDTVTARVELATAADSRPVTVGVEYGLALAAVAGAPVRVADAVMDRLAVPVPDEDMRAPFLPAADALPQGRPARHFEPRNMAFTDGLDYWELAASFADDDQPAGQDYSCAAVDGSAVLAATVPEPAGSAVLVQAIAAEDYRGRTVTFRGQLRATGIAGQAGLHLAVSRPPDAPVSAPRLDHGSSLTAPGNSDWTWHEVTMPVTGQAIVIRFGISLAGRGRVELRGAELSPARPGTPV
jgi:bifunctional DNase/RNase